MHAIQCDLANFSNRPISTLDLILNFFSIILDSDFCFVNALLLFAQASTFTEGILFVLCTYEVRHKIQFHGIGKEITLHTNNISNILLYIYMKNKKSRNNASNENIIAYVTSIRTSWEVGKRRTSTLKGANTRTLLFSVFQWWWILWRKTQKHWGRFTFKGPTPEPEKKITNENIFVWIFFFFNRFDEFVFRQLQSSDRNKWILTKKSMSKNHTTNSIQSILETEFHVNYKRKHNYNWNQPKTNWVIWHLNKSFGKYMGKTPRTPHCLRQTSWVFDIT